MSTEDRRLANLLWLDAELDVTFSKVKRVYTHKESGAKFADDLLSLKPEAFRNSVMREIEKRRVLQARIRGRSALYDRPNCQPQSPNHGENPTPTSDPDSAK